MVNSSENPLSPPKEIIPTPSITPSTTPISKKGRVKMMARKVVIGEEQIKKINEKLKASREEEPQKSDESFKSATEGEEIVSSKTEHVTCGPKVTPKTISEVATNSETRFVLIGTVAGVETTESGKIGVWSKESAGEEESVRETEGNESGEAAEGLVRLGKDVQEPVPSKQETLVDLLRKVSDSYNPKRKKSLGVKVPSTATTNKKRKAASFIPVETPPTRVRSTRSQNKQSEVELEKALKQSKKKAVAKGKKKMLDPVKDEEETKEMKVVTPKAKKVKTSTKKSVLKSRKVKIVEEEEWNREEEKSDYEKDKMVKFGKRTYLKSRLLRDLEEEGMLMMLEKLQLQG
ncbi:uncharacterized protein [Nicotiana sylvestris]|uniref:Uncharacterized protein LOC104214343 n=1 Tax=Nicotiana sylvestris TaxID=4096 RepID=A0A1U7V7C5_NICSY|nr:PREDICTED: uncharacterized protein LOC104214343 [Nicotiana sylvestris]